MFNYLFCDSLFVFFSFFTQINVVTYLFLFHPPVSLSELRSRVSSLEEELRVKAETLKSTQNEMVQSKKELASKDLSLQRARDELSLAHTRMAQESERVTTHY